MTNVSCRLPHERIIAVEMFRGPDHIAMRMLTVYTVRRQSRVCNALRTTRSTSTGGSASPIEDSPWRKTMATAGGAVPN
jgi:hypothetical protein